MQCKDIPDRPVLEFLRKLDGVGATWFDYEPRPPNTVLRAMPTGTPEKLALAKMRMLMRLAIVTAQPRECLVALEFSDIRDGFVWNERGKTGARIKLPLSLTVPRLGWNLDDCVKSCRDRIVSRHLLHHNINRTLAAPGSAVALNAASKGFQRAREAAGISGDNPPTLHEIRSLALRLYKDDRGRDFAQTLAGHKQGTTTDIYTDVRGAEWIEVKSA